MTMQRFLTETATTTRRGVAKLSAFQVMPVMPASPDVLVRMSVESPFLAYETYTETGRDILQGDVLLIHGLSYSVRGVETWTWTDKHEFMHLVLEMLRV